MKSLLTIISLFFFAATLMGQHTVPADDPAVQSVVEKFAEKLDLTEAQIPKMVTIQQRRLRNLAEISVLKDSDPDMFLKKRISVNKGTEGSIRLMLDKEQTRKYHQHLLTVRQQKADKTAELKSQGLTWEQIEAHLVDIDDAQY